MSDELIRRLAELPSADPDAARSARVRSRARARMARQAARTAARTGVSHNRIATAWQPAVAILGAIYLVAVIVEAVAFLPVW